MHRNCLKRLQIWAEREKRKPMILRGARQVGKTTLVRLLAKSLNLTLVEVNLEQKPSFSELLHDKNAAKQILEYLLIEKGIKDKPDNILFFFDEAQELPELIPYLRYFYEKAPEYRVIVTGSLLEFSLKSKLASSPVGRVEYSYLEPMSYSEFLLAVNPVAFEQLDNIDVSVSIPTPLHVMFYSLFKEYCICGGMPEVVKSFADGASPIRIDEIKNDILSSYIGDLPKYSLLDSRKYDEELLELLFKKVASSPSAGESYAKLAPGYRSEKVKLHLGLLEKALLVRKSKHSGATLSPLASLENPKFYKLFFMDIGLCYSYMSLPIPVIKTASELNSVASGKLAEQVIAQNLLANGQHYKKSALHHWQRTARGSVAEVDFLVENDQGIFPVECKSGHSNKLNSLKLLTNEKKFNTALRFYNGNIDITELNNGANGFKLISLPHYLVNRLDDVIKENK